MEKEDQYGMEAVGIFSLLEVIRKRKWWLVSAFLVILTIGLAFSFLVARDFHYRASTMITLPTDNLKYQQMVSEEYPEQSSPLWLIKDGRITNTYFNNRLRVITTEIQSEDFLTELAHKLDGDIDPRRLRQRLDANHVGNEHFLVMESFASTYDGARDLNRMVVESYNDYKQRTFQQAYDQIIAQAEQEIAELDEQLSVLSAEAEEFALDFNRQLLDEIDLQDNVRLELTASEFLPPALEHWIESVAGRRNHLKDILTNLENNEAFYTRRIQVVGDVMVDENFTYFRNILLSIAAALILSIILVYIVDLIDSIRKKSRQ